MAARTATKSGNWSDVTVWNGGVSIPTIGDTITTGAFVVTLDQNIIPTAEDIALAVRQEMDSNSTVLEDIYDEVVGIVSGVVDREDIITAQRSAISWPF